MAKYAVKIAATEAGASSGHILPTPDEMTVTLQTLDSAKSGRNNNNGKMHRDKVAEKLTVKISMPYGISHTEMQTILSIVKADSFWCYVIDPRTAAYSPINVYCATVDPPIAEITTNASGTPISWIYDNFELSFVEM